MKKIFWFLGRRGDMGSPSLPLLAVPASSGCWIFCLFSSPLWEVLSQGLLFSHCLNNQHWGCTRCESSLKVLLEASNKRQSCWLCSIFCTDSRFFTDFSLPFSVTLILTEKNYYITTDIFYCYWMDCFFFLLFISVGGYCAIRQNSSADCQPPGVHCSGWASHSVGCKCQSSGRKISNNNN